MWCSHWFLSVNGCRFPISHVNGSKGAPRSASAPPRQQQPPLPSSLHPKTSRKNNVGMISVQVSSSHPSFSSVPGGGISTTMTGISSVMGGNTRRFRTPRRGGLTSSTTRESTVRVVGEQNGISSPNTLQAMSSSSNRNTPNKQSSSSMARNSPSRGGGTPSGSGGSRGGSGGNLHGTKTQNFLMQLVLQRVEALQQIIADAPPEESEELLRAIRTLLPSKLSSSNLLNPLSSSKPPSVPLKSSATPSASSSSSKANSHQNNRSPSTPASTMKSLLTSTSPPTNHQQQHSSPSSPSLQIVNPSVAAAAATVIQTSRSLQRCTRVSSDGDDRRTPEKGNLSFNGSQQPQSQPQSQQREQQQREAWFNRALSPSGTNAGGTSSGTPTSGNDPANHRFHANNPFPSSHNGGRDHRAVEKWWDKNYVALEVQ